MYINTNTDTKQKQKEIPLIHGRGKVGAVIRGDILDIQRHQSNLLRLYNGNAFNGFCLSVEHFEEAKKQGCKWVTFKVIDARKEYSCSVAEFEKLSLPYHAAGFGRQLAFRLAWFKSCERPSFRNDPMPVQMGFGF